MLIRLFNITLLILSFFIQGCNSTTSNNISIEAENYLNEVLDIMEVNSLKRLRLTGMNSEKMFLIRQNI